jgi:hypothetical protein
MNKKELLENLQQTRDKYVDLLWYARSGPENEAIKGVKENKERIEASYPYEVKELHSENSDWQHGFHSGMVAALRYILTMDELGVEQAKEEFPELDS